MANYPKSPVMRRLLARQKAKKSTAVDKTPKPKKGKEYGKSKG